MQLAHQRDVVQNGYAGFSQKPFRGKSTTYTATVLWNASDQLEVL
jgi:hypothetical protein